MVHQRLPPKSFIKHLVWWKSLARISFNFKHFFKIASSCIDWLFLLTRVQISWMSCLVFHNLNPTLQQQVVCLHIQMLAVIWSLASSKLRDVLQIFNIHSPSTVAALWLLLLPGGNIWLFSNSVLKCVANFSWVCFGICFICVIPIMSEEVTQQELALDFEEMNQRMLELWRCCLIADCLSYVAPFGWQVAV